MARQEPQKESCGWAAKSHNIALCLN